MNGGMFAQGPIGRIGIIQECRVETVKIEITDDVGRGKNFRHRSANHSVSLSLPVQPLPGSSLMLPAYRPSRRARRPDRKFASFWPAPWAAPGRSFLWVTRGPDYT